jgi:hypothetical protein
MRRSLVSGVLSLAFVLAALPARAQAPQSPGTWNNGGSSWTTPDLSTAPRGGLLPATLFDPSRFSIRNSLEFGYSTGGAAYGFSNGSAGLFTSSLGYKMRSNMNLSVDAGAHMNPAFDKTGLSQGVFVEGAKLDWHPTGNSILRIEYRDYRSPLQNPYGGYGYGYDGLGPAAFRN